MSQDRKYKILVVDDERAITTLLSEFFEMHGYETATAFSGEEAIRVAESFHPDILVSDVVMGQMNGIEAAIKILRTHPTCKVLFISGNALYDDTPGQNALAKANAQGLHFEVLQKPIRVADILSRVAQICIEKGRDTDQ
jgi:CheY-like chemotaxis protein